MKEKSKGFDPITVTDKGEVLYTGWDYEVDVIPFATPEMLELKRMKKEWEEEKERKRKLLDRFQQELERVARPKKEGRARVAEWCFLNFKFFDNPTEQTYRWLRNFICSDGYANSETCRRLGSLHRRIAKHCQSPFSEEELIQWELEQPRIERDELFRRLALKDDPSPSDEPFKRRF
jgi:hypothetical protein